MKKMSDKKSTSVRLSQEADDIRKAISEQQGISQSAVIEIALREYAKRHGVTVPKP